MGEADLVEFLLSIGRLGVQFTDTESNAIAPLGQDRSPQLPR